MMLAASARTRCAPQRRRRQRTCVRAPRASSSPEPAEPAEPAPATAKKGDDDELGDAIASGDINFYDPVMSATRFVTRRFGFFGALGFIGILASTEGYEIVRALLEKDKEGTGEVVETGSGLAYVDIKVGGGVGPPKKGDFVGVSLQVAAVKPETMDVAVLFDTNQKGRPLAFTFGRRPFAPGIECEGLEEALSTMRRGGIRQATVPPALAFGKEGGVLPNGARIPPNATLIFTVEIKDITTNYLQGLQ